MSRCRSIRRSLPFVLIGAITLTSTVQAQSSVSVYGLIDVSIKVVNNFGGGRRIGQDSGDQQAPRLGFQGSESLGGGVKTVFVIETGFNVDTGGFAQGGAPFARQVYLGLSSPLGTLTAGRQYDFMTDLGAFHAVWQGTGTLDWNLGDNDRVSGERLDNSLKYVLKTQKLTAGAMYSLSESSGTTKTPSASSFLASYAAGGWAMAAAATLMHNSPVAPFASLGVPEFFGMPTLSPQGAPTSFVADRIDNFGVGASYTAGPWSALALMTETRYDRGLSQELIRNRNIAARYGASSGFVYALSLAQSSLNATSVRRAALAADYFLSKRTDLYVYAVKERASGTGARAVLFTAVPSSDGEQHAVVVGMRHKF
jgi:outer membrane protein OmpU